MKIKKKKTQKIYVTWDWNRDEYVWATNPHDLQVLSPSWGHNYQEAVATERQLDTLRNGGWISIVTPEGDIWVKI